MRRLFIVVLLAFLFVTITGCSNDKAYNELLDKGLESIEQQEYKKAEVYFEQALDEKEKDEKASALLEQTMLIQEAEEEMIEGEFEQAEKAVDSLLTIENGSYTLVERATNIKKEMEEIQADFAKLTNAYKEAEKLLEENEYDQAIELVEQTLDAATNHRVYDSIKNDLEELVKESKNAKEEAAIAAKKAKEKEAQQKKEAEKKKAEQAAAIKGIGDFSGYWMDSELACHITSSYMACALPYSDFITNDSISGIQHVSDTEVQVTFSDGSVTTMTLSDNNATLHTAGGTYTRVSKDEANAIYDGYYELP